MQRAFPNKLDELVEKYNTLTEKRIEAMSLHHEFFRSMLYDLQDKGEVKSDTVVYGYKCTACLNELRPFTVEDYLVATSSYMLKELNLNRMPASIGNKLDKYQRIVQCDKHRKRNNGYMATAQTFDSAS